MLYQKVKKQINAAANVEELRTAVQNLSPPKKAPAPKEVVEEVVEFEYEKEETEPISAKKSNLLYQKNPAVIGYVDGIRLHYCGQARQHLNKNNSVKNLDEFLKKISDGGLETRYQITLNSDNSYNLHTNSFRGTPPGSPDVSGPDEGVFIQNFYYTGFLASVFLNTSQQPISVPQTQALVWSSSSSTWYTSNTVKPNQTVMLVDLAPCMQRQKLYAFTHHNPNYPNKETTKNRYGALFYDGEVLKLPAKDSLTPHPKFTKNPLNFMRSLTDFVEEGDV